MSIMTNIHPKNPSFGGAVRVLSVNDAITTRIEIVNYDNEGNYLNTDQVIIFVDYADRTGLALTLRALADDLDALNNKEETNA